MELVVSDVARKSQVAVKYRLIPMLYAILESYILTISEGGHKTRWSLNTGSTVISFAPVVLIFRCTKVSSDKALKFYTFSTQFIVN